MASVTGDRRGSQRINYLLIICLSHLNLVSTFPDTLYAYSYMSCIYDYVLFQFVVFIQMFSAPQGFDFNEFNELYISRFTFEH